VRDLWPHSLQMEHRWGLFLRERLPPPAWLDACDGDPLGLEAPLLGLELGVCEAKSAGSSRVETGEPIVTVEGGEAAAFCRLVGTSTGTETLSSLSAWARARRRQSREGEGNA
jgi:hypothetical protein